MKRRNCCIKIVCVTCIVMMGLVLLALTGCGSESAASPYVGTWKVYESYFDGYTIPSEEAGVHMEMTLNADGTYTETINDYQGEGEWSETEDGIAKMVGGLEYTLTLNDDDQLVLEQDGTIYYYEKVASDE